MILGDRSGKLDSPGDLVGSLLGHAEEIGNPDETDGPRIRRRASQGGIIHQATAPSRWETERGAKD
jgi:hypothetical protein